MVGIRGAAVVVTAVAVTVTLLSGCELVATGGQGAGPSEAGTATTAPAAKPTTTIATPKPSVTPSVTPKPEPTPTKTRPVALLAPGDKVSGQVSDRLSRGCVRPGLALVETGHNDCVSIAVGGRLFRQRSGRSRSRGPGSGVRGVDLGRRVRSRDRSGRASVQPIRPEMWS